MGSRLALALSAATLACSSGPEQTPPPREPAASRPAEIEPAEARGRAPVRIGAADSDPGDFFAGSEHDPAVPAPDSVLGAPVGSHPARCEEIAAYLRAVDAASERVRVEVFGRTHEGRELLLAVVASPANQARLDAILADIARLADPRGLSDEEADRIARETPAVAWLGYSIHGDEMSGCDAALAVLWHLAAGTSPDVAELLERVVVVIDPCMNPDGRTRILTQLEQCAGRVANLDDSSMHRGRWPYGRGNHYLFDMNRDWTWGVQPETRARWAAIARFNPQLLVDAHEMGALDTFLFYPPRAPVNPHYPEGPRSFWERFSNDQAHAFDRHGWSYYTREWAESWYIGYSDSWAAFHGAVGILYEQARLHGQPVRRASGEITTYREAVQRQVVSSFANLGTLAENREDVLRAFLAGKRRSVEPDAPGNDRMFVLALGRNRDREAALAASLAGQGIEVYRAEEAFEARDLDTPLEGRIEKRSFPAGTVVIPARQPLGALVQACLDLDPRFDATSLREEREELERKHESRIYDVTAWSMAHAYDLDAGWCDAVELRWSRITALDAPPSGIAAPEGDGPAYGWVVDGADDASVAFAARAMELGLAVHLGDEPFRTAGQSFARGSLLVRAHENAADAAAKVAEAAEAAGVIAVPTPSGRSPDDGPDLGGGHFHLLHRPRVAVLTNHPVNEDAFGHTWHLLDVELGLPFTMLDAALLDAYDLRRYNAIVLPPASDELGPLLAKHAERIADWVKSGGTLIASGTSAALVAEKDLGITSVRLRQDVLDRLDEYAFAVDLERRKGDEPIDPEALWNGRRAAEEKPGADADAGEEEHEDPNLERRDEWQRLFSPRGAILRGEVDEEHWITVGCRSELPVLCDGDLVLLSMWPVRTPVRLSGAERLRLSGLLWPEARERLADSAWLTVEPSGDGQVILFAAPPDFRGWFKGTTRLLANAVVYGPGAGAKQPTAW